jgi:sulfate transport system ATP-binding protein
MTVLENVSFGLKVRPAATRPTRGEIRRRAGELLDLVQLSGLERRYPSQLSGGQRQRVALARAMAIEPKVLLLDEPFGALDAQVRRDLRKWLRDIHDLTGHTTVFVTHDQEEALELADRVVVMNRGHIEQVGTADEIYEAPNSPFVYGFIGESTSLPAVVADGQVWLDDRATGLAAEGLAPGPGQLYFRPHEIELTDGCGGCIAGTVSASRRIAGVKHVELEVGGAHHRIAVSLPSEHPAAARSRIAFRPHRWRFFADATSGKAAGSPAPIDR